MPNIIAHRKLFVSFMMQFHGGNIRNVTALPILCTSIVLQSDNNPAQNVNGHSENASMILNSREQTQDLCPRKPPLHGTIITRFHSSGIT